MNTFYQLVNAAMVSSNITYSHWVMEELFSPAWLIIVTALAISCVLLFKLIDRSRLREILLYASILAFIFGYIDVIATEYGLWEYKTHVLPLKSSVFPFSYTMNPIFHMFAYQYGTTWRRFALLNTVVSAFFAFIAHPFYVWSDVLWIGNWNYVYWFIVLMSVTFGIRALVSWLAGIERRHVSETELTFPFPMPHPVAKLFDYQKDKEK